MSTLGTRAREFAEHVHIDQKRKYTREPYFMHLADVAALVALHIGDEEAIAAAWLHDCIEDQNVALSAIAEEFGHIVALYVYQLTDAEQGPNRAMRKVLALDRLSKALPVVQSIKCADLISNTASIVQHDPDFAKLYLQEKRATLTVLDRANPELHELAKEMLINAERKLAGRPEPA